MSMLLVRNGKLVVKNNAPTVPPAGPELLCVGTNCAGGTEPSMSITITADDSQLPRTWCGKTWIKSSVSKVGEQYYSGESACVCPTYYYDNPTEPPPFGAPYTSNSGARQNWGYGYELNIDAFWEFAFTLLNLHNVGLKNRINARVGGQFKFDKARRIQYLNTDYWPTTPTLIGTSLALSSQTFGGVGINFSQAPVSLTPNTNVIAYGFKHPTLVKTTLANLVATSPFSGGYGANMNGRLDDGFFGRVTTTTGAVYEWKKGDNWGF